LNLHSFSDPRGKYSACFQIFKNSSGHKPKSLIKEEA